MKKIISVLLLIAMVAMSALSFASCEALTAVSALAQADEALSKAPYTFTLSMDLHSDNDDLNTIFDAVSMDIPVTVDGKNLALDMSMDIVEGISADLNMVVVENILYYNMSLMGESVKMKAAMTQEQYDEFMEDTNSQMPIDPTCFETLTLEAKDGKHIITCTDITADGTEAMNELLGDTLSDMSSTVTVGDLSFVITLADGKYESMELSAIYSANVEGETVSVSMTMKATFAYENVAPVTAPADADTYEEMNYEDLMG